MSDGHMSPYFTVIIPTYNREQLVQEAIRSVLGQTFGNFEIIVVNDHSTDNTEKRVRSFQDNRIKYFINDRTKGLSGARNTGIYRAKGAWVAFLDDDDMWLPQKLELVYKKILDGDRSLGLVYTGYAEYDFDSSREISLYTPEKRGWIQKELLYKNYIGTPSVVAVRTDVLKSVGGCDEDLAFCEDADLYVNVAGLAKVDFIREKLTHVRISNTDRLSFKVDRKVIGYRQFWEKHEKMINEVPKLRHRAASLVFEAAVIQGNVKESCKALPWTLLGLLFDVSNVLLMVRHILSFLFRKVGLLEADAAVRR